MKSIIVLLLLISTTAFSNEVPVEAEKIELDELENFYRISPDIYRSDQPNESSMKALEKFGIRSILNLRYFHSDDDEAEETQLKLFRVPLFALDIDYNEILESLTILKKAQKPLLVHCLHGSDRTGMIIALYRIVFEDWTKEQAIAELKKEEFGYHYNLFPNIENFILELDVEKLKKDLEL